MSGASGNEKPPGPCGSGQAARRPLVLVAVGKALLRRCHSLRAVCARAQEPRSRDCTVGFIENIGTHEDILLESASLRDTLKKDAQCISPHLSLDSNLT